MTNEEIKKMTWQKQSENNIVNAVIPWDYHRFACVMKDNSIQIFTGTCDETYDGEINTYISQIESSLPYSIEDIIMWIEVPDFFFNGGDKEVMN